ncbi:CPBP family intramembrane glutamic endopeptidase, partial [Heyndrickxia sporothermodurans]|uniref:CPBP family intramembrane glutamic endopeptidase n=2 Tax=Heyndrickxia sporothermodurans TaxID=46224 RepID=UPI0036336EF2
LEVQSMKSFLNPEKGLNQTWRYIVSIPIIFIFIIIGILCYIAALYFASVHAEDMVDFDEVVFSNPLIDLFLTNAMMVFWIIGLWVAARILHRRSLKSFITPYRTIRWKQIIFGFSVTFSLLALFLIIDLISNPNDYYMQDFQFSNFLLLILISLILTPVQTTAEELLFRGFLLQFFAKFTKSPIVLSLIIGGIFGILHFSNPEMENGAFWIGVDYIVTGVILTYVTIKTNSLEATIGAHAANNVFISLFIASNNLAVGHLPSLFFTNNNEATAITTLLSILPSILFMYIMIRSSNKNSMGF